MTDTAAAPVAPAVEAQSESAAEQSPILAPISEDKPSTQQRLKPIPNKPSMPGILSENDSDFFSTPVVEKQAKGATQADGQPARDASGKFVALGQAKTDVDVPEPPDGAEPEPVVAPSKYVFDGEEYDSEDAFKQNFKSMRGSFKKNLERATQAEIQLGKAAESARAWKAEHDRILSERGASAPVAGLKANAETQSSDEPEGIDEATYAYVKRIATEQGTPEKADLWLAGETNRIIEKRIEARLAKELMPLRQQQQFEADAAKTNEVFSMLADYANEDGSAAFPELQDEAKALEIGRMWSKTGLPREHAQTPQGAVIAVLAYRGLMAAQKAEAAGGPPAPVIPSGPRLEQVAAEAANIGGGRAEATPADPSDNSDSAVAKNLKAAMRKTTLYRPNWGFEA